ncbi:hypothetical protein [Moraxella sp. K127]|uniref:crAss001_48 related protein n=1 Tax=Moraxella sp. K127 TaxID=2780079 RepID=UPI001D109D4E|nr:hypothetical protein [Moraxella sp. K127]
MSKLMTACAMALFIATRTVNAKPMNRQEYNDLRGWQVPENENPADDGYLVVNNGVSERNVEGFDGYVSWLPKIAFDEQYKKYDTPIDRMQIELDDLYDRMDKLGTFIAKGQPAFLNDDEWALLQEQAHHMANYYSVLNMRLDIAKSK